ncbi:hypothetical protein HK098_001193 [Nowakowskiella sp. JEL0407]|nr:hypothetical protein HK098_001193 [Nowakowskiella sp. JEL0407]
MPKSDSDEEQDDDDDDDGCGFKVVFDTSLSKPASKVCLPACEKIMNLFTTDARPAKSATPKPNSPEVVRAANSLVNPTPTTEVKSIERQLREDAAVGPKLSSPIIIPTTNFSTPSDDDETASNGTEEPAYPEFPLCLIMKSKFASLPSRFPEDFLNLYQLLISRSSIDSIIIEFKGFQDKFYGTILTTSAVLEYKKVCDYWQKYIGLVQYVVTDQKLVETVLDACGETVDFFDMKIEKEVFESKEAKELKFNQVVEEIQSADNEEDSINEDNESLENSDDGDEDEEKEESEDDEE